MNKFAAALYQAWKFMENRPSVGRHRLFDALNDAYVLEAYRRHEPI